MGALRYLDFDLQIQPTREGYRSQVLNSPAGEASSSFVGPLFAEHEFENYLLKIGRPRRASARRIDSIDQAAAKDLGGKLFSLAFNDEVKDCLRRSLDLAREQEVGLRVRLRLKDAGELVNYPWEYLYDRSNNRFLSLSNGTPVVRYLDLSETISPLTVSLPLKILAMISSPTDYPELDGEREWQLLSEALAPLQREGEVKLERLEKVTLEDLNDCLQSGDYNILHFVGHGTFDARIDDGVLVFEDQKKRGVWTSGEDLGVYLRDQHTMRLAVLNACEGARGSIHDPFSGVAQSLVQQGLPAVIAMQFEITDEAAIIFSRGFYSALARGYPVDAAVAQARKAIRASASGLEWGTPVLYLRSRDGVIFEGLEKHRQEGSAGEPASEQGVQSEELDPKMHSQKMIRAEALKGKSPAEENTESRDVGFLKKTDKQLSQGQEAVASKDNVGLIPEVPKKPSRRSIVIGGICIAVVALLFILFVRPPVPTPVVRPTPTVSPSPTVSPAGTVNPTATVRPTAIFRPPATARPAPSGFKPQLQ